MTTTKIRNATCTCPFCGGSGKLPHFSHIQNGDCFACGATGKLRDINAFIGNSSDVMLTVHVIRGKFTGAELRCRTWKNVGATGREWGRDRFYREISNVDEARQIWRDAKRLGIETNLWDDN